MKKVSTLPAILRLSQTFFGLACSTLPALSRGRVFKLACLLSILQSLVLQLSQGWALPGPGSGQLCAHAHGPLHLLLLPVGGALGQAATWWRGCVGEACGPAEGACRPGVPSGSRSGLRMKSPTWSGGPRPLATPFGAPAAVLAALSPPVPWQSSPLSLWVRSERNGPLGSVLHSPGSWALTQMLSPVPTGEIMGPEELSTLMPWDRDDAEIKLFLLPLQWVQLG